VEEPHARIRPPPPPLSLFFFSSPSPRGSLCSDLFWDLAQNTAAVVDAILTQGAMDLMHQARSHFPGNVVIEEKVGSRLCELRPPQRPLLEANLALPSLNVVPRSQNSC
jgi:hypothetical protein